MISALRDITVVEVTGPVTSSAGRLLADAGAHVMLVESAELSSTAGRRSFRQMVEDADVLLEAEPPGRLAELGLDYIDLTRQSPSTGEPDTTPGPPAVNDQLIHISITPFGRTSRGPMSTASRQQPMTDLTVMARAGWLNPLGAADGQTPAPLASAPSEIAAQMAVMSALTALLSRETHGSQFVDVSILAAANTCAGPTTVDWLTTRTNRVPGRLPDQT